ncbi:MAG: biliverdin-producing heme oxygenase [Erythrobacter sp.]|nr:biliverdin-producing heme oxygenase [Erythrobacter sp.]
MRNALRRETADMHDTLDRALGDEAMASPREYARFLATQYRARKPIEDWVAGNMSREAGPPAQTPLIAADLAALGQSAPTHIAHFAMPEAADPVGLQWALAGSSLGNRAMLAQRRKQGLDGPVNFLSDAAMPAFFKELRPALEIVSDPARVGHAVAAAEAVFACFLDALEPLDEAA